MIAKIKIKGVRVWRAAWQRCVTFRERAREEGGAGGMDSCSKADCAGCLSYQGSSHASKSQIKHPHLSFQPAALLQVPAPSLPPCVTVPSVDYQLWSKAGALTGSEQNGEVGTWGISCCYHFVSGRCHFHGQIHMRLRYAFLLLFVQECVCVRALCRMVCGLLWLCVLCWRKAPGELLGAQWGLEVTRSCLFLGADPCLKILHLCRPVRIIDQTLHHENETLQEPKQKHLLLLFLWAIFIFLIVKLGSYCYLYLKFQRTFLVKSWQEFWELKRSKTKLTIIVLWKYITA